MWWLHGIFPPWKSGARGIRQIPEHRGKNWTTPWAWIWGRLRCLTRSRASQEGHNEHFSKLNFREIFAEFPALVWEWKPRRWRLGKRLAGESDRVSSLCQGPFLKPHGVLAKGFLKVKSTPPPERGRGSRPASSLFSKSRDSPPTSLW